MGSRAVRTLLTRSWQHPLPTVPRSWQRLSSSNAVDQAASLSPRWLSEIRARIGQCILFGLKQDQIAEAGSILDEIARDWRELLAGSEGFLTGPDRRSIHRREIVWGEMDSMGHVNNVVYNRFAESGRVAWVQKYATHIDPTNRAAWSDLSTPRGIGMILRTITTEFKFPMKWPDHVTIYHKLRHEPTDGLEAFVLDVLILSELHQRPAARCVEDIVIYDYQRGKKTPLPKFMLDAFQETWRLQEHNKLTVSQRVANLLLRVRRLEQASWDRPDAIEDMGGTT